MEWQDINCTFLPTTLSFALILVPLICITGRQNHSESSFCLSFWRVCHCLSLHTLGMLKRKHLCPLCHHILLPQTLLRYYHGLQPQFSSQLSLFLWLEANPLKSIFACPWLQWLNFYLISFSYSSFLLFKSWLLSKMGEEVVLRLWMLILPAGCKDIVAQSLTWDLH